MMVAAFSFSAEFCLARMEISLAARQPGPAIIRRIKDGQIKNGIGLKAADNVSISPAGHVWGQNPDGSWTNHGPASSFTGSGKSRGRRGKDRDR